MPKNVAKSEFKAEALEYLNQVQKTGEPLVITEDGKSVLELIPYRPPKEVLKVLRGSVIAYEGAARGCGGGGLGGFIVMMFLHVTDVEVLDEYHLSVTFNDGVSKRIDLANGLYGEVFEPLKDRALFRQVAVNPETNTVEWPNGADFAPEFCMRWGKRWSGWREARGRCAFGLEALSLLTSKYFTIYL